jgi:hypothetical protein
MINNLSHYEKKFVALECSPIAIEYATVLVEHAKLVMKAVENNCNNSLPTYPSRIEQSGKICHNLRIDLDRQGQHKKSKANLCIPQTRGPWHFPC